MSKGVVAAAILLAANVSSTNAQTVTWNAVPDLRIGDLHRPDYALSRVSDVAVGEDGSIFVSQPDERVIRVYDHKGRFARSIGREGGGPGEFRSVDTLTITPRGLLALDKSQRRLTLFTIAGRYVTSWGIPPHQYGESRAGTAPRAILADGSLPVVPSYRSRGDEASILVPLLQFDSTLNFQRNLAWLTFDDHSVRVQVDRLVSYVRQPVSSHTLWSIPHDRRGIVVVERTFPTSRTSGTFNIARINLAGDTVGNRQYRVPARRIPRAAIADSLRMLIDRVASMTPFPREQLTALYEKGWRVPEFQPPVDRVVPGPDGTVWLRRGAYMEDEATWWVIDSDGEIEAQVLMPSRVHILRVDSEHLWGIEKGEFDEQYVVRFRITR
jgi:hypothetical protein